MYYSQWLPTWTWTKHCVNWCDVHYMEVRDHASPFTNIFANKPWLKSIVDMVIAQVSKKQGVRAIFVVQPVFLKARLQDRKFGTQCKVIGTNYFFEQSSYKHRNCTAALGIRDFTTCTDLCGIVPLFLRSFESGYTLYSLIGRPKRSSNIRNVSDFTTWWHYLSIAFRNWWH